MTQHTSGPWLHKNEEDRHWIEDSTGSFQLALIAISYNHEANARLIVTAPDMLAVLQEWIAEHNRQGGGGGNGCVNCNHARAIIDKAEGWTQL